MKLLHAALFTAVLAAVALPARAEIYACTPAPDCGAEDRPCWDEVQHGKTKTYTQFGFLPGDSVIRVKLCTWGDPMCKNGNPIQAVSVFAHLPNSGQAIYSKWLGSLEADDPQDTGAVYFPTTIGSLSVRCNNPGAQSTCKVIWQHCRVKPTRLGF